MTVDVQGYNPRTGAPVGDAVAGTPTDEVDRVAGAAAAAFPAWSGLPATDRAGVLDALAAALDDGADELVAVADDETALGETRLRNEVGRTTGQLRMFADLLRRGLHVEAIISPADPAVARPDVRRMLVPIGPVAVFSASNFPFAFSVAGGDTASALAAGCPVVVKAHEGHPQTSVLVARILRGALAAAGVSEDVLGLVHGFDAGGALVRHPAMRAVGFTGSLRGGRALFDIAAARPDPIPFYGELGSVNPVVVLPGAARARARDIATEYAGSLTLGAGQFCTNPGLMFVPDDAALLAALAEAVRATSTGPMLSERIRDSYVDGAAGRDALPSLAEGAAGEGAWSVAPRVWQVDAATFAAGPDRFTEEIFGPAGLVVTYASVAELVSTLSHMDGSLTGSVHATEDEPDDAAAVAAALGPLVGRLIYNGWPTGVAVCWAMHHGGPWPATTASGHTSVGGTAIRRWQVPIAYQGWPQHLLPPELRDHNPLGLPRTVQE
ncbi:MAG TPA: aldehyde dehydrogenase (NADP(+)) [Actinophytocola sp.]|uniref:aldehyde dehydrogenase (NADP(+)) n=1 Tax=Actinophytocola sp. TaxID=1872138 RepID=UPI002DBFA23D|nr:aldehyde dehydrogenase (NADP(+)) [Actinophytocola sp.]HEU5472324.1 aldehyde dehydrogenase (NADP(+)) [Actinophytocola sp.]